MIRTYPWHIAALGLLAATCSRPPSDHREPAVPSGQAAVLVVTTDFSTGSYAVVDPVSRQVRANIATMHADAVCRYDAVYGRPLVISRLGGDAVAILDSDWNVAQEYSVGAGTNAQDIAVADPDHAVVAAYDATQLPVVAPTSGRVLGEVDVAALADDDGIPEVAWVIPVGDAVFAAVQRLDRNDGFSPTEASWLAVIDPVRHTMVDAVALQFRNPFGKLRFSPVLHGIVVVSAGAFDALTGAERFDGGVELVDPDQRASLRVLLTGQEARGDILDAVVVAQDRGYAVVGRAGDPHPYTVLLSFDPRSGTVEGEVARGQGWDFSGLLWVPDSDEVWMGTRDRAHPGIRIFDAQTGQERTSDPLDVGLPPFDLCYVPAPADGSETAATDDAGQWDTDLEDTAVNQETGAAETNGTGPSDWTQDTDTATASAADSTAAWDPSAHLVTRIVEAPCADTAAPFGDPALAVNGVRGGGATAGSTDVFSFRGCADDADKYLTLAVDAAVLDGPGDDIAVFENGFFDARQRPYMEPLVVFVSWDGTQWEAFAHDYVAPDETVFTADISAWSGFAGVHPVLLHEENNPVDPFDREAAGGDGFDIAALPDTPTGRAIREHGVRFIRLVQASSLVNPDTGVPFPEDPFAFDHGADIDGVYVRYTAR